jgi:hypothetical protein
MEPTNTPRLLRKERKRQAPTRWSPAWSPAYRRMTLGSPIRPSTSRSLLSSLDTVAERRTTRRGAAAAAAAAAAQDTAPATVQDPSINDRT